MVLDVRHKFSPVLLDHLREGESVVVIFDVHVHKTEEDFETVASTLPCMALQLSISSHLTGCSIIVLFLCLI